jgi:hypothetical protein
MSSTDPTPSVSGAEGALPTSPLGNAEPQLGASIKSPPTSLISKPNKSSLMASSQGKNTRRAGAQRSRDHSPLWIAHPLSIIALEQC